MNQPKIFEISNNRIKQNYTQDSTLRLVHKGSSYFQFEYVADIEKIDGQREVYYQDFPIDSDGLKDIIKNLKGHPDFKDFLKTI